MAGLITDLTSIGSIDRANDVLEIVDVSANASYKVTPNNLVGISGGSVVSTTDTQTLTNKVLGVTNTITVYDSLFTIQDNGDATKQVVIQASGITTGNTRTLTVPDASGTLVLTGATQTLTSKTLTSPTITGGTLDNTTVTVDSVAGHTTSNTGTIYGISVTTGTLASAAFAAGAVNAAAIATNAVTGPKLATNAIYLGVGQITGNITTASTTVVQAAGLTVTVTVPAGGRSVLVLVTGQGVTNGTNTDGVQVSIWHGVVGSGTQLAASNFFPGSGATSETPPTLFGIDVAPGAGSITYNVGFNSVTGGTTTWVAGNSSPGTIAALLV